MRSWKRPLHGASIFFSNISMYEWWMDHPVSKYIILMIDKADLMSMWSIYIQYIQIRWMWKQRVKNHLPRDIKTYFHLKRNDKMNIFYLHNYALAQVQWTLLSYFKSTIHIGKCCVFMQCWRMWFDAYKYSWCVFVWKVVNSWVHWFAVPHKKTHCA